MIHSHPILLSLLRSRSFIAQFSMPHACAKGMRSNTFNSRLRPLVFARTLLEMGHPRVPTWFGRPPSCVVALEWEPGEHGLHLSSHVFFSYHVVHVPRDPPPGTTTSATCGPSTILRGSRTPFGNRLCRGPSSKGRGVRIPGQEGSRGVGGGRTRVASWR